MSRFIFNVLKNFKRKYLIAKRILKSCLLPDTYNNLPPSDILLIGHEHHYNLKTSHGIYSPILGSLFQDCQNRGDRVSILLRPFSALQPDSAWNFHYSCNRYHSFLFLIEKMGRFCNTLKKVADEKRFHFWISVFSNTSVSKIFAIQPDRYMCQAARELGVVIVDVQHGVINDAHPWYGSTFNDHVSPMFLPHQFWVWDDFSYQVISNWATPKGISVLKTGHIWIDRFRHPDLKDSIIQEAISNLPRIDTDKPCILITLQWDLFNYTKEETFNGYMHQALEDYVFETQDQYNWLIRLHPVQLYSDRKSASIRYMDRFRGLDSVEWQASTFCALPALLGTVDAHITFSSSVVIEAEWFGVNSALLDKEISPLGRRGEYYKVQRENGSAEVINPDRNSIDNWVIKTMRRKGDFDKI